MWNNFFKHIDIKAENTHILDGNAADLQAECDAFEKKITAAGGIQLFVGGQEGTQIRVKILQPVSHTFIFFCPVINDCKAIKPPLLVLCQVLDLMATLHLMSLVQVWYPGPG